MPPAALQWRMAAAHGPIDCMQWCPPPLSHGRMMYDPATSLAETAHSCCSRIELGDARAVEEEWDTMSLTAQIPAHLTRQHMPGAGWRMGTQRCAHMRLAYMLHFALGQSQKRAAAGTIVELPRTWEAPPRSQPLDVSLPCTFTLSTNSSPLPVRAVSSSTTSCAAPTVPVASTPTRTRRWPENRGQIVSQGKRHQAIYILRFPTQPTPPIIARHECRGL